MKVLTRLRRILCVVIAFALVVNTANVNSLSASAVEVTGLEESGDDTGSTEDTGDTSESEDEQEEESESAQTSDSSSATTSSDDSSGSTGSDESTGTTSLGSSASGSADDSSASSGDEVTVSAELSSGIPSNAELVVESADESSVLEAIDLEGMTTTLYYAMSIHLEVDGEEYTPASGETVTLTFENLTLDEDAIADMWFFHIHDDGDLDDHSFANAESDSDFSYADNGDGTYDVTYTTSSFSDFVIASQVYGTMAVEDAVEINLLDPSLATVAGKYEVSGTVVTLTGNGLTYNITEVDAETTKSHTLVVSGTNNTINITSASSSLSASSSAGYALTIQEDAEGNTFYMDDVTISNTYTGRNGTGAAIYIGEDTTFVVEDGGLQIKGSANVLANIVTGTTLTLSGSGEVVLSGDMECDGTLEISGDSELNVIGNNVNFYKLSITYVSGSFLHITLTEMRPRIVTVIQELPFLAVAAF